MDILTFYKEQSKFTDPRRKAYMLEGIQGRTVEEYVQLVQDACLDYHLRDKYPVQNERFLETNSRYVDDILGSIAALEKNVTLSSIETGRPKDMCAVSNTSQYANLLLCLLRSEGIPCRKRVGFIRDEDVYGVIEYGDKLSGFETHEIVEYYQDGGWKKADPQGLERFEFIPAAEVYKKVRAGELDADEYKDAEESGLKVVIENLMLDLAAVNKWEMLAWDRYGWMQRGLEEYSVRTWQILDQAADALTSDPFDTETLKAIYESEEGLMVPEKVYCNSPVVPPHFELIRY